MVNCYRYCNNTLQYDLIYLPCPLYFFLYILEPLAFDAFLACLFNLLLDLFLKRIVVVDFDAIFELYIKPKNQLFRVFFYNKKYNLMD